MTYVYPASQNLMSEGFPKNIQTPAEGQPLHDAHVKKFESVTVEKAKKEAWNKLQRSPERVQGRRHVETVRSSIYSKNRDVADRMEKLLMDGFALPEIIDDLMQEATSRPITSPPEYKEVARNAAMKLRDLENADFDKARAR